MLGGFWDAVIYFVLYSFIGWISEVAYAAYKEKRFVNRGVLAGPICPIYGFGALFILGIDALTKPRTMPVYMSITLAIIITTVLEYITGYILERFFNIKAWDYSNEEFNLHGRICLKFSLLWGIFAYMLLSFLHPVLSMYVNALDQTAKQVVAVLMLGMVVFDTAKTLSAVLSRKNKRN
ncbi:putative ABC transporter permease [Acetivibrio sp.]|uniref:putative ABC transporter permease n=1 Tax=Acetivibrio sp. TaxID=1872092 RepID=UPI002D1FA6E2|nr:putative ABC transporter permease [Acetivibrio sp.]